MANEKFTQLPTVTNSTLADIIAAVQGGVSVQQTLQQVQTLMLASTILHNAGNPNGLVAGVTYQFCWDTTNSVLYVCTTSGNAATAVWTVAGSFSFPLAMSLGGTSKALTASAGGIVWTDSDSMEILAGTATAGQMLQSGNLATPAWSTATFASTYAASTLLYSNGANTVVGLATANSAVLRTTSAGVPGWSASMTNGQLMIGSTGATPVLATLTGSGGISIVNTAGAITISGSGSGYGWTEVTGTTQSMAINNGYIANNVALVTLTLPAVAAVGDTVILQGKGSGLYRIAQNAGQIINFGSSPTTVGAGGSLTATNQFDSIELICITANTTWAALTGSQGAFTVV